MAVDKMVSQLASNAINKALNESSRVSQPDPGRSFKEILSGAEEGKAFAESLGLMNQGVAPSSQMEAISVEGIEPELVNVNKTTTPETSEKIVNMLSDVNKGSMQMENLINNIMYSGKRFSQQEMLVMQAHVYHHAQMMELTVKMAGQSVSSVKAVLNTQVQ